MEGCKVQHPHFLLRCMHDVCGDLELKLSFVVLRLADVQNERSKYRIDWVHLFGISYMQVVLLLLFFFTQNVCTLNHSWITKLCTDDKIY